MVTDTQDHSSWVSVVGVELAAEKCVCVYVSVSAWWVTFLMVCLGPEEAVFLVFYKIAACFWLLCSVALGAYEWCCTYLKTVTLIKTCTLACGPSHLFNSFVFVICRGKGRDTKYLVKWCDLSYEDCTWEYPGEVDRALEDEFTRHIDLYWDRRFVRTQIFAWLCVCVSVCVALHVSSK